MSISGILRGHPITVRLTRRERRMLKHAEAEGFLVATLCLGMVDLAHEMRCGADGMPCVIIRRDRSTASITLDLAPAGLQLDDDAQREIRLILFKASCQAPNPAARGRLRRTIITPTYVYARVPLAFAEATAQALLGVAPSRGRRRRTLATGQGQ